MKRLLALAGMLSAVIALALVPAISASASTTPLSPQIHAVPQGILRWAVSPRVNCGGFNGDVEYNDTSGGGPEITIWGELWSSCGTTYVYLSWDAAPFHHNADVASASVSTTVSVSPHHYYNDDGASYIAVTVCSTYGGWHCGAPDYVSPINY